MPPIEIPDIPLAVLLFMSFTGWLLMLLVTPGDHPTDSEEVQGRRTGSSGQAPSSSRTERRAKRTLDPAPPDTASALESGAAPPPRAPEPSAARVG